MTQYQVLARKYRPQTFSDVLNQDAIVATLKNAIKNNRLAQAYLFCGSRGTGKTTLARILAKALNCQSLTDDIEPCNRCSSCLEITSGYSMDVLEIDGASNRGIDDIRQINETVSYAASSGKYKIYIIDEVHMLTKEAFNALLKTLEEPPPNVKFLFATTEAHKVLPTILSRCQRFNLKRISTELIQKKLRKISDNQNIQVDDEALRLVASSAEGGLRDAESLFDQILAFHSDSHITTTTVATMLGLVERERFFDLDRAALKCNYSLAFEIAEEVFSQGKDLVHFVESLTEHYRNILLIKLKLKQNTYLNISEEDLLKYEETEKIYSTETCLAILDYLVDAQNQIKYAPAPKIALENLLIKVMRLQSRVPVDILIKRLAELENKLVNTPETKDLSSSHEPITQTKRDVEPKLVTKEKPFEKPTPQKAIGSISEDPTPSKKDLGIKDSATKKTAAPTAQKKEIVQSDQEPKTPRVTVDPLTQSRYDTILQFAAIELEGIVQKKLS